MITIPKNKWAEKTAKRIAATWNAKPRPTTINLGKTKFDLIFDQFMASKVIRVYHRGDRARELAGEIYVNEKKWVTVSHGRFSEPKCWC